MNASLGAAGFEEDNPVLDQLIEFHLSLRRHLLTREQHQLADDVASVQGGGNGLVDVVRRRFRKQGSLARELRESEDIAERLVQLVRDAGS